MAELKFLIEKQPEARVKAITVGPLCPLGPALPARPFEKKKTRLLLLLFLIVLLGCISWQKSQSHAHSLPYCPLAYSTCHLL